MGNESVHLRCFHSDEVMVVFFIAECASKFDSKFESRSSTGIATISKKYTVIEVEGTAFRRLWPAKVLFCCAQPPKWCAQSRTEPQIAVFLVSEVVIASNKGTLFEVVSSFLEKLFWLFLFFRGCVYAKK